MARSKLARRSAVRTGPHPATARLNKFKAAALARSARAGAAAKERKGELLEVASGAALGYLTSKGMLPTVAGISPAALYGVGGVVAGMALKGKAGKMLEKVGFAGLTIAAFQLASGQPLMAGMYDDLAGDDTPGW
jgi:hypothetical protein